MIPLADKARSQGVKVYRLNIGAPDIKSPQCALDAVKNHVMDHVSYTNSAGLLELREGFANRYYKSCGVDITPDDLLVTVAGSEAIDMAMKILMNPGDELILMEPYYTNYNTFAIENEIVIRPVPTDIRNGFKVPSMDEFEKLVTPRTKAIMISHPGNPTGTLYTKEEILSLGEIARKHDLFLISDEVYREFCYTDEPHFSAMSIPGLEQNVVMVDSISKRYNLCGARIGTIVTKNHEVLAAATKYAQARLSPPAYGQIAALGALDTPKEYFQAVKEEYIRRRDYTIGALNAMEGVFTPTPQGAFYTIVSLPVDDAEDFARWMLTDFRYEGQTVQITPAKTFYSTPGKGLNQVRIAYVLEIPELHKAMKVLEEGLKAYPGRTL